MTAEKKNLTLAEVMIGPPVYERGPEGGYGRLVFRLDTRLTKNSFIHVPCREHSIADWLVRLLSVVIEPACAHEHTATETRKMTRCRDCQAWLESPL